VLAVSVNLTKLVFSSGVICPEQGFGYRDGNSFLARTVYLYIDSRQYLSKNGQLCSLSLLEDFNRTDP
jgi:hypothetical protein